jgi:hypothetical protein
MAIANIRQYGSLSAHFFRYFKQLREKIQSLSGDNCPKFLNLPGAPHQKFNFLAAFRELSLVLKSMFFVPKLFSHKENLLLNWNEIDW